MARVTVLDQDRVTIQAGRLKAAGNAAMVGAVVSLIFYAGVAYTKFSSLSDREAADEAIMSKLVDVQSQQAQTQAQLTQGMKDLRDDLQNLNDKLK